MDLVTYELKDHIATITLNRPEARNAINGPLSAKISTPPGAGSATTPTPGWGSWPPMAASFPRGPT
jgi:hypothetical protein